MAQSTKTKAHTRQEYRGAEISPTLHCGCLNGLLGNTYTVFYTLYLRHLCHENVGWSKLLGTPLHQRVLGRHCAMC